MHRTRLGVTSVSGGSLIRHLVRDIAPSRTVRPALLAASAGRAAVG
jgi:hypothetical protein